LERPARSGKRCGASAVFAAAAGGRTEHPPETDRITANTSGIPANRVLLRKTPPANFVSHLGCGCIASMRASLSLGQRRSRPVDVFIWLGICASVGQRLFRGLHAIALER